MPPAQDIFNELLKLGDKLDTLNATSQAIKTDDDQLLNVVGTDLGEVVAAPPTPISAAVHVRE